MYERVRHSPASKLTSPSSPLCLFSTSFGNLALMSSQRPWFTRVSDLVAFRSHEPTRTRHRGQLRLLCSNVPLRQRRQRLCVHGSVTGSINIPRHTGHMRSRRCTSAVVRDDRSNNFDVRFRYIFPYLLRDYGYCTGNNYTVATVGVTVVATTSSLRVIRGTRFRRSARRGTRGFGKARCPLLHSFSFYILSELKNEKFDNFNFLNFELNET